MEITTIKHYLMNRINVLINENPLFELPFKIMYLYIMRWPKYLVLIIINGILYL